MILQEEVITYIKSNPEINKEIYIDRDFELSEEQIQQIFDAKTKDDINEVLNSIENEVIENNLDLQNEGLKEFKEEIISKFGLDEDDSDLMEELDNELEDYPVYLSVDSDQLIRNSGDVHLTVAVAGKENPKYWEDDQLMLPGMYRESVSDSDDNKQNLSNVCAVLGIDKKEMETAYSNYFKMEKMIVLPEPTLTPGVTQTTADKFIYDWENQTSDYGVLTFMTRISLDDYIKNFDRIKEDGIVIPAGAYCGLHDPMQGACSLMEIEVKTPIVLPVNIIDISAGDESHNHGYSLEKICGLTEEAWGKRGVYAGLVRTDKEKELIALLKDIVEKDISKGKDIKALVIHSADILSREIERGDIDARSGMSDEDIFKHVAKSVMLPFWFKDQTPEDIREKIAFGVAQAVLEYAGGKISKDKLFGAADALTAVVNDYKVKQIAGNAPAGNLEDAVSVVGKQSKLNLEV